MLLNQRHLHTSGMQPCLHIIRPAIENLLPQVRRGFAHTVVDFDHPLGEGHLLRVAPGFGVVLQQFQRPQFGETNIGLFLLKSKPMFEALRDLRARYWDGSRQCYERPGGELGFPNELINSFGKKQTGVFACPIADSGEEQGIKELADIARCEQIIVAYRQGSESPN